MSIKLDDIKKEIVLKSKIGSVEELYQMKFKDDNFITLYNDNQYGSDWIFKIDFLSTHIYGNYSWSMFSQYLTIFKKSKEVENYFKKDLCDFSESEMLKLLKTFRARSYSSITNKYSLIKHYMEYAKNHSIGRVSVPSGMLLTATEIKETICDYTRDARYCTREELERGLDKLDNPNDKIPFALLFEGVCGSSYSDLLNVTKNDVCFKTNTIKTPSGRVVKISNHTAQIVKDAIEQTVAVKLGDDRMYKLDTTSPYLLKGKLTVASQGKALKYAGLNRKLDVTKKIMGLDFVTGVTVYASGLAERIVLFAHEYYNDKKMTNKEMEIYLEEHGESKDSSEALRMMEIIGDDIIKELKEKDWDINK